MSASELSADSGDAPLAHRLDGGGEGSKRIEAALNQLEHRAELGRDLLDLAQALAFDLDGRILVWTSANEALYGWSKAESAGRNAHDLLQTTCAQSLAEINRALATAGSWEGELVRADKAGQRITLGSRWVLHRDSSGKPDAICEVSSDITELKRAQLDLQNARAELERYLERTAKLYEMIGELEAFSYSVAHDLRAPLRAINGYAELLQEQCKDHLWVEAARTLGLTMAATGRMDRLIQDVLALSKLSRADLQSDAVNVEQLLQGILDSSAAFQPPLAEIHLERNFPMVLGNSVSLTQCITNLLTNAVKFVAPGIVPRVDIWAERKPGFVRLWFADNGIGIAESDQAKIFGMFQRVSRSYEGTGLGLAIVSHAALRMGGKVGVESELGKGCRFWLELPGPPA